MCVQEKMDVYSLGILLFLMLAGRHPYSRTDVQSLYYAKRGDIKDAPGLKDPL